MDGKRVVYEVNISVDKDVSTEFGDWLLTHINDMLKLPGFLSAELFEQQSTDEKKKWTTCYRLENKEAMELYYKEHAAKMRSDALNKFTGKFQIERRELLLVNSFSK